MIKSKTFARTAFIAAIGFLPVACAQPSSQPATQGMSSGNQGMSGMSGMSGMQGHDMQGMDMQAMMKQCADMRQQMAQGTHQNTPDMSQMMAHCDEMDRSMGSMPGMGSSTSTAPAATRTR